MQNDHKPSPYLDAIFVQTDYWLLLILNYVKNKISLKKELRNPWHKSYVNIDKRLLTRIKKAF